MLQSIPRPNRTNPRPLAHCKKGCGVAISLKPGTRTTLCGRTGSGKSTVAVALLRASAQKWILIDPKADDKIASLKPAFVRDLDLSKIQRAWANGHQFVALQPPPGTESEEIDAFILFAFNSLSNFGLYVDELYYINSSGRCGAGLQAVLTRGRSDKITFLGATQRPAFVCGFCFSEADTILQMRLIMADDRKKIYTYCGNKEALENPEAYCIHCHTADGDYHLVKCKM